MVWREGTTWTFKTKLYNTHLRSGCIFTLYYIQSEMPHSSWKQYATQNKGARDKITKTWIYIFYQQKKIILIFQCLQNIKSILFFSNLEISLQFLQLKENIDLAVDTLTDFLVKQIYVLYCLPLLNQLFLNRYNSSPLALHKWNCNLFHPLIWNLKSNSFLVNGKDTNKDRSQMNNTSPLQFNATLTF